MDTSSTEAEAVYFDKIGSAVYKLYRIDEGNVVNGIHPGELEVYGDRHNTIKIPLRRDTPLLEYLRQREAANEHGGTVFTEIAGFTEDGDLVLKQPYISNVVIARGKALDRGIASRGFAKVINPGMWYSAVGWVDGKPYLFIDLSPDNVMMNSRGDAFFLDAVNRPLTAEEFARLDLEPPAERPF